MSYIPLKKRKPRWYCVNKYQGTVQSMAGHEKTLYYIIDPREIRAIKKMLGNPDFFKAYDYLLITRDAFGEFDEIYGVTAPTMTNGFKDLAAFTGVADRVLWGWAQDKRHYDAIVSDDGVPAMRAAPSFLPKSCVDEATCGDSEEELDEDSD